MKLLEKKTSVKEKKEMEWDKLEFREKRGKEKKIMVTQQGLLRRQTSQRCLGSYCKSPVAVLFCFNPTCAFTIELLLSMIG